jgi:hypothetical protein
MRRRDGAALLGLARERIPKPCRVFERTHNIYGSITPIFTLCQINFLWRSCADS